MPTPPPIRWIEKNARVDDLKEFDRNPRKISDAALATLEERIKQDGYHQRILAQPDLRIVGGHQRKKVLKKLGIETIQVLVPDRPLTDEEFKRIVVRDNLDPLGEFDRDILAEDYAREDLIDIGVPADVLRKLDQATRGLTDPDAVPDRPTTPVTKPGDVWIMGDHKLICGDCTQAQVIEALLGNEAPHLMVTDPPYGVKYDPAWRIRNGTNTNEKKQGKVLNDDRIDWRQAWALFPGDVAYIYHASYFTSITQESLEASGFEMRCQIIWNKDRFALSRGHYHWKHEPCWYAVRTGSKAHWQGARDQSSVWDIPARDDSGHGHGTQKPVECMRRPIENNSAPGDMVYDPFLGSGTTLIAAEMMGRRCRAVELNPAYVDVAVLRWQQFTGQVAVHAETNAPFGG